MEAGVEAMSLIKKTMKYFWMEKKYTALYPGEQIVPLTACTIPHPEILETAFLHLI
jgi:hypothetical protein